MNVRHLRMVSLLIEGLVLPPWLPRCLLNFTFWAAIFACGLACCTTAEPKVQGVADSPYRLHFFHTHTGERLNIVYRNHEKIHVADSFMDNRAGIAVVGIR